MAHLGDVFVDVIRTHEVDTLLKDRFTLIVRDVVVFEKVFTDLEVALLDLFLRGFERLVHPWVNNGFILFDAEAAHDGVEAFGCENAEKVVFDRDVELGTAGVTLTACTTTQLVVDPAAFVTLGTENEETARIEGFFLRSSDFGFDVRLHGVEFEFGRLASFLFTELFNLFLDTHFEIAAELNVGTATGHIGRDRDCARLTGLCNDMRFTLVVAGIQNLVCKRVSL